MVEECGYTPDCVAYLAKGAWQIGEVCANYFNVPIVELTAHRSGDAVKDDAKSILQALPRCIRKLLRSVELRKRFATTDGVSQKKTMKLTTRFEFPKEASRILIVDDAADTGSSLIAAQALLLDLMPDAEVKTGVITSFAPARLIGAVDFSLYKDALLCSPMSKDNRDYAKALAVYEGFRKNA